MALPYTNNPAEVGRHPHDPEPVPSTKSVAALALSIVGVIFSPAAGGVIPALMALELCRQAEKDIADSDGFLLGAARCRKARKLARLALGVTAGLAVLTGLLWVFIQLKG